MSQYRNIAQAKAIERKNKEKRIDLTGQRYGRLIVLERAEPHITKSGKKIERWKCKCDCGNETVVRHGNIRNGSTTSCGCYHKEKFGDINRTHNLSNKSHLYGVWKSIKDRCYREKCKSYKNYGGRGIKMCDEWKNDYKSFYVWAIENGYEEKQTTGGMNILSIDRIDVNGDYCPSNCRFVTNIVQARNKRNTMTDDERYSICPICGKEYVKTSRNRPKTCSYECGIKLRTKTHINTKNYTKICPMCGKEFNAKRGGHYKDAIYCSNECRNLSFSPTWEYNGESHRVVEWSKIIGINAHCLLHRKDIGWTIEEILTTPLGGKRNAKN